MEKQLLIIDDFIEPAYFESMKEEITSLEDKWTLEDWNPLYTKRRLLLDNIYKTEERLQSKILNFLTLALFNDNIYRRAEEIQNYCFQTMRISNRHVTYVTSHIPTKECIWHTDAQAVFGMLCLLNFVLYVDIGAKYKGGDLLVSYDTSSLKSGGLLPQKDLTVHETITPKDNRLVLIPSHLWHMVKTTKCKQVKPTDGRVTINGHIGFGTNIGDKKLE